MIREATTNSYQALTKSTKPLKCLIAWLIKSGMLTQLSLAIAHLYQQYSDPHTILFLFLRQLLVWHPVVRLPTALSIVVHGFYPHSKVFHEI